MLKILKQIIISLLIIGSLSCSAENRPHEFKPAQNLTDDISYKIAKADGVSVTSFEDRNVVHGEKGFRLVLVPAEGDAWDMKLISVLGLMIKNTGESELVLDMMLCNDEATEWSNSSLGRTIVKPGEEIPLGIALARRRTIPKPHPAYFNMSGLPNGHFSHWHTIDPARVVRLEIQCSQRGNHTFELAQMFPKQKMDDSLVGVYPFIDQYGQYILKEWPGKVHSNKDIVKSIATEKKLEEELSEPTGFSKYGGWKEGPEFEATGRFRTVKYQGKWWFVDPEGYLFWSHGVTCVGVDFAAQTPLERDLSVFENIPSKDDGEFGQFYSERDEEYNYALLEDVPHYEFSQSNLYRKYGKSWEKKYVEQEIRRLKYCKLNTIGAWSDNAVAAQRQVPYTAMIHYEYAFAAQKLPDPFDPATRAGLRKSIREYPVNLKNDPWCIGAFVNNELHWNNDAYGLAIDILSYDQHNEKVKKETTEIKKVFRDWLKEKYVDITTLNQSWKTAFSDWDDLLKVTDPSVYKNADRSDCSELTKLFANAFFKMIKEELENYLPGLLYLGCRFHKGPDEVILTAGKYMDVISVNIYSYKPNVGRYGNAGKPVLISEFHFVNTTGSNLGGGLRSAQDAVQQGRLYNAYIKEAVNHPMTIGAHWFQWRDQNVGGRYDGENYDVGFFDVADVPNEELIRAAEECGRNLYTNVNQARSAV